MNRIRELRLKKPVRQEDLAKYCRVGRTTVAKWESGDISLTENNIKKLMAFFEVSSDTILGLDSGSPTDSTSNPA